MENTALENLIQLGNIPLIYVPLNNLQDTQHIPISNKYKGKLDVIGDENLKELSKFIDTVQLLSYTAKIKQRDIDTSIKCYSNIKLFNSTQSKQFIAFSKPVFLRNYCCYIEVDFQSTSGVGYFYLLSFADNKWKIILKRETWVS